MPFTVLQEIEKSKLEHQIHARYRTEIDLLREVGFEGLHFIRELTFPFSVFVYFWAYPLMLWKREIVSIESPLRFATFNPIAVNHTYGTYAEVLGLGVVFFTRFMDGAILISSTHEGEDIYSDQHQFYRYSPLNKHKTSIDDIWALHRGRIERMERMGRKLDNEVSLLTLEAMMYENERQIFGLKR